MFGEDLQEIAYEDDNMNYEKLPLMTAFTFHQSSCYKTPTNLQIDKFPEPQELSIDRGIYLNNARLIKEAIIDFFNHCLNQKVQGDQIFYQNGVFEFASLISQQENTFEALIQNNLLLNQSQKKQLLQNLEEFQEFSGLVLEFRDQFGKEISQEILFIAATLFDFKMKDFRAMTNSEDNGILPKIERFWGNEGEEELFKGTWNVYEYLDYKQVKKLASDDVENLAMKVYFSEKLKYLTLRDIKKQLKEGVSVADKFATLVIELSRNIFLSLAGMAQDEQDIIQTSNDLSLNYIQQENTFYVELNKKVHTDL